MPQRRGTWKKACGSELQQLHTEWGFKLHPNLPTVTGNRERKKLCSLTDAGKAADRKKRQPGNHCCSIQMYSCEMLTLKQNYQLGYKECVELILTSFLSAPLHSVLLFISHFICLNSQFTFSLHCWVSLAFSRCTLSVHQACFTTLAPMRALSDSALLFTTSLSSPCISLSMVQSVSLAPPSLRLFICFSAI